MFSEFIRILKWFTNITDIKKVIALMGAAIIFLTYFFIKRDNQNTITHTELKLEYKKRLDTCEKYSSILQGQSTYWKDSLASEKLKNANIEIERVKNLVDQVKKAEKNVIKKHDDIINKQKQILNKLKYEN